ncbi:amino acid transporter [Aspergillus sclerotioniger CBS 115572]|uniref:Amino acid transporter n=1 Tax=Aspergillus sclerotioniger CBS 115572 TaxID=1450535 RepID=A0A317XAD5_9EURO|nr:amino acid transporter [Aspergillus sclerotioniger CBS 115572]PWY95553.1 amino acid transporter [Aspergillus sclerotioniger CBS 115572]
MADTEGTDTSTPRAELPRQFTFFSTAALGFSITNSWLGYSGVLSTPLIMGGSPTAFFGLIIASIASCIITAGFAELSSAFPSSGGPYHFAFMVSWPKHRALVTFVVGWLSVISWCTGTASGAIICAQMISSLVAIHYPSFTETTWRIYLIYLLTVLLSAVIVCLLPRAIPRLEDFLFICSLLVFLASLITVLAMQAHKQSAHTVFLVYENHTGWSDGTAFMIGTGTCMYSYVAMDSVTHIADEVPDPGRNVPRAMMTTILTGIITTVPWAIALLFCTTDLGAVSSSPIPIYTAYLQATSSQSVATFFTSWIIFLYGAALLSGLLTTGRLAYSFARSGGLPFSPFFARVTNEVPLNATVAAALFIILYGLIYIVSTTAFNSLISLAIIILNVCYVIPQGIVLLRGRDLALPRRSFAMGKRLGTICNAVSVLWVTVILIFFCFPLRVPTTVHEMNYVSAVITGFVVLIAVGWWGGKRTTFSGPVYVSLSPGLRRMPRFTDGLS